ncbi:MAG: endoribonuclease MazF [Deltaproteobacteria bacterium]|nr:endoribonuclease MazF [Deltaproteobacteria bacterium]
MVSRYIPDRGDVVWLDFTPQSGHEQAGKRPALVLSPFLYNQKTRLMVCCPITSKVKGYPFEVPLPDRFKLSGVILADQLKNLDWFARKVRLLGKVPPIILSEVWGKIALLLNPL